jgi:hypothetical protein
LIVDYFSMLKRKGREGEGEGEGEEGERGENLLILHSKF